MSIERTKEADLIGALYLYASRCWAEGDILSLREMGFGRQEIEDLLSLNLVDVHRLCSLNGHPLRVRLDAETFRIVVEHLRRERRREETMRALITADAPLPMMQSLYGMDSKEYSGWRHILSLPPATGRPAEPDEAAVQGVWRAWRETLADRDAASVEPIELLRLHEALGVPLRVLWQLVQRWSVRGGPWEPDGGCAEDPTPEKDPDARPTATVTRLSDRIRSDDGAPRR